jgi:Fungal specific transcription factor domain
MERASSAGVRALIDNNLRSRFLDRAAEALVIGGYQKARPYSVEAVLFFAYCRFLQTEDPDSDAWMVMGIATRLALRMGYHRDPCHFPKLSPFEGEMRRRIFFLVEAFDLLLSFPAGLPPVLSEDECDTAPPRNLLDEDFDENCTELPPSRPPTEATSMLYFCYKSRFARIFRRVIRQTLSLKNPLYEDTMRLDQELLEVHNEMPPCLEMKPLSSFIGEKPSLVFDRMNIDLMYLKCICVLHRQYITQERSNPMYEYSRRVCMGAALTILAHQTQLHAACQPGGQFFQDKWMVSSLILYDFILAGIVVCLDLYESLNNSSDASLEDSKVHAERYDILTHTRDIWLERKETSRDARRAANVLSVMLSKISRPVVSSTSIDLTPGNNMQPAATGFHPVLVSPSFSTSWESTGDLPHDDFDTGSNAALDFSSALFTDTDQIDWVSFYYPDSTLY